MNQFWKDMGVAFIMGFLVPAVLLAAVVSPVKEQKETGATEPLVTLSPIQQLQPDTSQVEIPVLGKDGQITPMPINAYLTAVLLAEMPVSFEDEALKAQAVVARTYTMRALQGAAKHEAAAVCTDASCCQGYIDRDTYLQMGGTQSDVQHIWDLVLSTEGQVLMYEGSLIEATYFSCSGGMTEDAVAVWGTEVPYLKSVVSPGEEEATYFTDSVTFTLEEFEMLMGMDLTGAPQQWFRNVTYTDGGGVAAITVGDQTFSGTQFRELLSLRSTAFTIEAQDNSVIIHTRGYGHRVGMSQYGANAMAVSGSTYDQILAYYYQGTQLSVCAD